MKEKSVTMRDVAALAGVSVSTVSHVLNTTRFVEETTKQKILQAIKTLNYQPNILAQRLKGKGTRTRGVLIEDIRQTFFANIIKAIKCGANQDSTLLFPEGDFWEDSKSTPLPDVVHPEGVTERDFQGNRDILSS